MVTESVPLMTRVVPSLAWGLYSFHAYGLTQVGLLVAMLGGLTIAWAIGVFERVKS